MYQLEKKVFGKILAMEIIGSEPNGSELEKILEVELQLLLKNLEGKNKRNLQEILDEQITVEKLMNSRPGAMAISQEKIRIFTTYSQKYIAKIRQKQKSV